MFAPVASWSSLPDAPRQFYFGVCEQGTGAITVTHKPYLETFFARACLGFFHPPP